MKELTEYEKLFKEVNDKAEAYYEKWNNASEKEREAMEAIERKEEEARETDKYHARRDDK